MVPSATRAPARWNAAATALIWATSVAVVAFWVVDSGVQELLAVNGASVTSLGQITGLVSANLLCYQVLLMARVPLFEHGFGRDAITRAHRTLGWWSFWLLLAHIGLVTVGYSITGGTGLLDQAWQFVWTYPGMLLATLGTVMLVAFVVIASLRAVRRRLRYESWHLLHLYGYLGAGLALPHELWTGAVFLDDPLATTYWWTLWAVAAGCVVVWRIVVPLARSARFRIRVASVVPDGARGVTVTMTGTRLGRLRARAGQFFIWRFLDEPGWTRGHPLSLSAAPTGDALQVTARIVGDGTERLARLRPGTRVLVEGPYGTFTGQRRAATRLLMIGAGSGVAPLVSLLESEPYRAGEATLVTRDTSVADTILTDRISDLVARRGVIHYRLDGQRTRRGPRWLPRAYEEWHGPDLLRSFDPDIALADVYLAGPPEWMAAVRRDLAGLGLRREQVHLESFAI